MQPKATLTPGLALGLYPQRPNPETSRIERAIQSLAGRIERHRRGGSKAFGSIVAAVNDHSGGLPRLSDDELRDEGRRVRSELSRSGLTDAAVARAFALVREAADRCLGKRPYDVQIVGGWLMMQGMLAEMATGEGKTLTAALPACAAALAGIPVHVVTVNDYLVERDARLMGPLFAFFGLTVGAVVESMDTTARQQAYRCDIVYCSNKTLVFDYLRDRLTLTRPYTSVGFQLERLNGDESRLNRLLLRGLYFAIVDEADSVLVDEARTPLIISREIPTLDEQRVYQQALALAENLEPALHFAIDVRTRTAALTDAGKTRLEALSQPLGGLWRGRRRAEELVCQALSARYLFVRDKHYLVRDGKVQIVDEYTGRVMADRSWERGLHQMIEAKEDCPLTSPKETLARISYQQFFRRYLRLAGMTGTAREIAPELAAVYRLNVVRVPTHRPPQRTMHPTRVFATAAEKLDAMVTRIAELHGEGRPVLVGTRSVAASERLSALLQRAGLHHQVLNARQDGDEAEIVSVAGERGRITVATNMAGRGTDIQLGPGVKELGGLHVIATEMHEARRIDRQLFGRCGRQGDPGSCEMFLSLEDEIMQIYAPKALLNLLKRSALPPERLCRTVARTAQRAAERSHARIRRRTLQMDEQIKNLLAFSGAAD